MVGRNDAGLPVSGDFGAVDKVHHGVVGAKLQHEAPPGSFGLVVRQTTGTANNRCHIGQLSELGGQPGANKWLAIFRNSLLGHRDQRDHPLICFPRIRAETENTVLHKDETFDGRIGVEHLCSRPGKAEIRA